MKKGVRLGKGRKRVVLAVLLLTVCLTACACAARTQSKALEPLRAVILMPDGAIIEGICTEYGLHTGGVMMLVVDGTKYMCGQERVVLYREGGAAINQAPQRNDGGRP